MGGFGGINPTGVVLGYSVGYDMAPLEYVLLIFFYKTFPDSVVYVYRGYLMGTVQ